MVMETKHTPGPWVVDPPSEQTPHIWVGPNTAPNIAKLETWDRGDGRGERLDETDFADARLIAAAPDLLECLKRLSQLADGIYVRMSDREFQLMREAWEKADAAIAKAEGR
jgi:hypothetical protein